MPNVPVNDENFGRLQKIAIPLVDDINSVIGKCIDAYEKLWNGAAAVKDNAAVTIEGSARLFKPHLAPDLTHTKLLSVNLSGIKLHKQSLYWNSVLNAVIQRAGEKVGNGSGKLLDLIIVNCVPGQKEDSGYHYIPSADLSVQGQDANASWKAIFHILKALDLSIDVTFMWHENEKASNPGAIGRLLYPFKQE